MVKKQGDREAGDIETGREGQSGLGWKAGGRERWTEDERDGQNGGGDQAGQERWREGHRRGSGWAKEMERRSPPQIGDGREIWTEGWRDSGWTREMERWPPARIGVGKRDGEKVTTIDRGG